MLWSNFCKGLHFWEIFLQYHMGSMLWSQFSAIFAIFGEKFGVFLKHQCSDQIYAKGYIFGRFFYNIIWGRCYDHNFLRFLPFLVKNLAFFLNTNVMIKFLQKLAIVWAKTPMFLLIFSAKNHNIGPWSLWTKPVPEVVIPPTLP
jgi:hypothetical protein